MQEKPMSLEFLLLRLLDRFAHLNIYGHEELSEVEFGPHYWQNVIAQIYVGEAMVASPAPQKASQATKWMAQVTQTSPMTENNSQKVSSM